jgi:hypothetical protein
MDKEDEIIAMILQLIKTNQTILENQRVIADKIYRLETQNKK